MTLIFFDCPVYCVYILIKLKLKFPVIIGILLKVQQVAGLNSVLLEIAMRLKGWATFNVESHQC